MVRFQLTQRGRDWVPAGATQARGHVGILRHGCCHDGSRGSGNAPADDPMLMEAKPKN